MMMIFQENFLNGDIFKHNSPLTFFAYDDSFKNIIKFSIGLRGFIPFLRIISVIKDNDKIFLHLLKSIEDLLQELEFLLFCIQLPKISYHQRT